MALIGESAYWADAWTWNSTYTHSWTVEMPPSAVFAKVSPAFYMEYHGSTVGMMGVSISRIRRRRHDDSDETVDINAPAVWEPRMTSITYSLLIYNCQARILCDLGFWG